MTIRVWLTGALAGAAMLTASASASAQDCTTDADCGEGLSCVLYGGMACPGAPPCEDGFDCPDFDETDCVEEEFGYCEPVPSDCTADSDCAGDFVCVQFSYELCSGESEAPDPMPVPMPGGDAGSDDEPGAGDERPDVPVDVTCEEVTEAYCVPPYVAPCDSDAACGAGFSCVEVEVCACSGGGSTGSDGGEMPPMPGGDPDEGNSGSGSGGESTPDREGEAFDPEVDCTCSGSGEFYCQPEEVVCATDADCAEGWSCDSIGDTVCTYDASTGEEFCEEGENYCLPPNWDVWGGASADRGDDMAFPTAERADGSVTNADDESNAPSDPVRPLVDEGCSAAAAPAAASWMFLLLGVLGLRRRRA